jgi:hypothetical protein
MMILKWISKNTVGACELISIAEEGLGEHLAKMRML